MSGKKKNNKKEASSIFNNYYYYRKFPLFLEDDDKNFKKFIHGMSMLNYNIVYICHTQGVKIPSSEIANTLQCLMAICRAPKLGM